jgi:hypothetical protein
MSTYLLNTDKKLLCGGGIRKTDGGIYSFGAESYALRFLGEDGLHGKCDWTYNPPDGESCKVTAMRANNNNN